MERHAKGLTLKKYALRPQKIKSLYQNMNKENLKIIDVVIKVAIDQKELKRIPPETVRLLLFRLIRYFYVVGGKIFDNSELLR